MVKKRKISPDELKEILRLHEEWLESGGKEGVKADLSGTNLNHAHFRGADLSHAHFSGADLHGANFRGADLSSTLLNGANLREADLSGAVLCRAAFRNTDLRSADLRGAKLSNAWFSYADLSGAKLSGVDFYEAVIDKTTLYKTDLVGAKFSEEQLSDMIFVNPGLDELKDTKEESPRIIRSIEFPPEYHQAGISILNYFGTILRDKYPDKKAKVKIEQDGLKVTMIIESEEGNIETIEKLLDNYGLVIHGKMPPDELCENKYEILKLENKLELATVEIKMLNKTIGLQEKEREYKSANIDKLLDLVSLAIQNTGNKTTTINITGETVAIGKNATATTITKKYEDNKVEIDKALEEFKKVVTDEMQQQVDALTAALKDKDEKKAAGIWENIKKVFTAAEKTVKTSEKAAKLFLNAVDLLDKL